MKTYLRVLCCCLSLWLITACTKDEPVHVNKPGSNLFATIAAQPDLSLYRAALQRAGILEADTFSVKGPFTVFAPVDSAFIHIGLTLDSINKYNPDSLKLLLEYGMVYGRISSSTLIGFYAQDMFTKHPTLKPRVNKNYYGFFFNGIPLVTDGSTTLADGVLDKIARVSFPQHGTLLEVVHQQPDLTFFAALLDRTGYASMLTDDNQQLGRVVFAPTNDAFREIGYADVAAIQNGDISNLVSQMQYMVRGPRLYTCDFIGGYSFYYDSFYIAADGFTILTTGTVTPTHIIRPDILGTNGTLQVVDQVFFL